MKSMKEKKQELEQKKAKAVAVKPKAAEPAKAVAPKKIVKAKDEQKAETSKPIQPKKLSKQNVDEAAAIVYNFIRFYSTPTAGDRSEFSPINDMLANVTAWTLEKAKKLETAGVPFGVLNADQLKKQTEAVTRKNSIVAVPKLELKK